MRLIACLVSPVACLIGLVGAPAAGETGAGAIQAPLSDWDALIPPDDHPTQILARHGVRFVALSQPQGQQLFAELEQARRLAPVVPELDGRGAELRGFVVPLDGDDEAVAEFLLVPETGYCIHTPLPPANQVVLVRAPDAGRPLTLFSEVQVRGRLRVEERALSNGRSGYALDAQEVVSER